MVFDWRAESRKPGVKLLDVEGSPVLGNFESREFKSALTGNPVRFSRVVENGAPATLEEFEALVAELEARPKLS